MRRLGLRQYQALKQRIFRTTAALVLAGIAVAAAAGGTEAAEAFILGGSVAFIYQLMLNRSVDSLPLGSGEVNGQHLQPPGVLGEQALAARGGQGLLQRVLSPSGGSSVARLALTGALMLGAILGTQLWDGAPPRCTVVLHPTAALCSAWPRADGLLSITAKGCVNVRALSERASNGQCVCRRERGRRRGAPAEHHPHDAHRLRHVQGRDRRGDALAGRGGVVHAEACRKDVSRFVIV